MTRRNRITPKTEIERSALEMVRAGKRLANIKKRNPLWAGTCKETLKHLVKLENQIHNQRKKSNSEARIHVIAKELANMIGNLCKSLIRYKYHFRMKCRCFAFS